jgi:hypothetical protein
MDFTCELCKAFGMTPFSVLQQEKDEVIMLINYFILKGDENTKTTAPAPTERKEERKRVNFKTASGGWF